MIKITGFLKSKQHPFHLRQAGVLLLRGVSSLVDYLVMLVFLLLFLIGCYAMWDSRQLMEEASAAQYETYRPKKDDMLPFAELRQRNADVFSWLTVYGTQIDYPVVQGKDNHQYLNTNAMGEFSLTGSIYLDFANTAGFQDFNSIIYGHHMEQNAMFGDLDQFLEQGFFESHQYGNLFYDDQDHGIEFFAFLEADAYDWAIYRPGIREENVRGSYLADLQSKSKYWREIGVGITDRIVLLSTCASDSTNGRYILAGRIAEEPFADPFGQESDNGRQAGLQKAGSLAGLLMSVPVWVWIILLLLILVLFILLVRRRTGKRQKEKLGEKYSES